MKYKCTICGHIYSSAEKRTALLGCRSRQEADASGNGRIQGPLYEDALLARASKRVILTAERIVGDGFFASEREKPQIPGFLVSHVVHAPRGAAPGCCPEEYGIDPEKIRAFREEGGDRP